MGVKNTLAYYDTAAVTAVKSFTAQAVRVVKLRVSYPMIIIF